MRWWVLGLVGVMACGGSRADYCRRQAGLLCDEAFRCASADAATRYGDQPGCVAQVSDLARCGALEGVTCPGEDLGPAYECLDHNAANPVCGDVRANQCASPALPLAGCVTPDGTVACAGLGNDVLQLSPGRCELGFSECTDGHRYAARCDERGCSCEVDGRETKASAEGGACDVATVNARCGWKLR